MVIVLRNPNSFKIPGRCYFFSCWTALYLTNQETNWSSSILIAETISKVLVFKIIVIHPYPILFDIEMPDVVDKNLFKTKMEGRKEKKRIG